MYTLPNLNYGYNDLEPYIDEETMRIHHTKHHQTYVDNLNIVLKEREDLMKFSVDDLLKNLDKVSDDIRQTVINNAGGHANHTFFWNIMTAPQKSVLLKGTLASAIDEAFGSFYNFKDQFSKKALSIFGSGWAFLILTRDKKLALKRHSFQNSPLMQGNIPVLGVDVWEHAYYLKYQNRKAEYIENWWNVVNWEQAENNYSSGLQSNRI